MNIGHNTASGQKLTGIVERVESIRKHKKELSQEESAVLAQAKADGYVPGAIRAVLKIREMKPQDRQEAEAILDTYLHAMGMIAETPLFRHVGMMEVDVASRDSVIEALKRFVPETGSIVVDAGGGQPVRLTRDDQGNVLVSEVVDRPEPRTGGGAAEAAPARTKVDVPDVDGEGAEALGEAAFKANAPIISNPFPYGDDRRPRWDGGWRRASGSDGMGPGGGGNG